MPSENWYAPDSAVRSSSGATRSRTWVVTPNFFGMPKRDLPINPYTDRYIKPMTQSLWGGAWYIRNDGSKVVSYPPAYVHTMGSLQTRFADSFSGAVGSWVDSTYASLINAAKIDALVKAGDAKVNLAVSIAEARKTTDMILGIANRYDRAYRAFRKLRFREVATILHLSPKTVHKTWLEYKYGWMPLLMEVKGAAELFAQRLHGRPIEFYSQGKKTASKSFELGVPFVPYGGVNGATYRYVEPLKIDLTVKVKLWLQVANSNLSSVQQMGLTNPALYAWEVIPYSFVFDWFVSVGDYLQALTALNGLTVRKGVVGTLTVADWSLTQPATVAVQSGWTYFSSTYTLAAIMRQYGRVSYTPSVTELYPPSNLDSLSFNKLVTGLALLRAQRR